MTNETELRRGVFLPDLLVAALDRNRDQPAMYIDGDVMTANELRDRISRYAQVYAAQGLTVGTGVAMLSKNRPEVLYAMGAYMVNGCRNTPLHPLGSLADHAHVLIDGEIDTLVFDPLFADRAEQLRQAVPGLTRLFSFGACDVGVDLDALAAEMTPAPLVAARVDGEDLAALAYTGGTTGTPKGVMAAYRGSATMTQIMMAEWQWPDVVKHLVCTPLSHAGAGFVVPVWLRGGSVVVLPQFEAGKVLETIESERITTLFVVPTMLYALLDHPRFDDTDLSSLQTVFYGASPMSPTRMQEAIRRVGKKFFQFYGQTEVPQSIMVMRKEEHDPDDLDRLASCGRPVPWVHVALLDDDGNVVAPGEPGEICVQGPLVMKGYWKRPDATAEVFAGGWAHTGDVARQGDDGFYTIVDRKKDMIVSGGFNVYPREIEDVISTHPSVASVAVIGVPDELWGEAVKAVVVARAGGSIDVGELTALVKERKGAHHAPKSIDVVESIPLTSVGKPDKKALRARYWTDASRQVG